MAGEFKSSFIPKEPVTKRRTIRGASKGSFMGLITTIIVILIVVGAGGTFLYKKFLESSLESKIEELAQAEEKFDPILIEELIRLDRRLSAADTLIESHKAVSNLFEELETLTSQKVRFESFSYSQERGEDGLEIISLSGMAESFAAVAHQSDVFGEHRQFQDVIFSDLAITELGNVSFRFGATVDPGLTDYSVSEQAGI